MSRFIQLLNIGQLRSIACCILLLVCMLPPAAALANRKTDVIHLQNGDRITGEFKKLVQGELELSTSHQGTLRIKWQSISWIESDKYIEFELADGTRLFGKIMGKEDEDKNDWTIYVQTLKEDPFAINLADVVKAQQIRVDASFWERLDGEASIGLNYTKASDVLTWNVGAETRYSSPGKRTRVWLDSTVIRKGDGTDTQRHNLVGNRQWLRDNRWFDFANIGAQQNEELGLQLRLFVNGGRGRYLKQTPKTEVYLALGLSANQENQTGDTNNDIATSRDGTNVEGLINLNYTFFRLYSPKSRVKADALLYPGISDTDRIRALLNLSFSQEFIADLFWELSFYYDYDSKPLKGALATEDFGIVTSLGYQW